MNSFLDEKLKNFQYDLQREVKTRNESVENIQELLEIEMPKISDNIREQSQQREMLDNNLTMKIQ